MIKTLAAFGLALVLVLAMSAAPVVRAADSYPSHPIRIVVAYPAGGSTDTAARLLADRLGKVLKQTIVVENRPGAGGVIGAASVAKAQPDGYTLLFAASPELSIAGITTPNLPYDPNRDFAPVTLVGQVPFILVANNDFPANNVQELIAYAKAHPGKVNFSSFGTNTSNHLGGELFNLQAGINMTHVPYRGSSPSLTDLMGGQVQVTFDTVTAVFPLIKSGKIKALAIATAKRSPLAPDLPTVAESGVPGYTGGTWFGLLAPSGTPPEVIQRLSSATRTILESDDIREQFASRGIQPAPGTPDDLRTFLAAEIAKWKDAAQKIGIKTN
ncbi:tripartite tricarboxylate transporter substrate binding protein [Bordetella sp. BOR01]|uniref:Bug family tripartite tricarboxylate transporter substrate binding protein n=1 Tax=Bordetella sp. BOR01 TaxID=2854779 RepID=UPI001C46A337|nr:tripartite tricarboxylate transporter substrate binding protein [Bordetella sp. BOR01]MBV7483557.1 tripartite tricarboxylate transporter substrate binding protein [Bordetella sp. BOR01]